MPFMDEPPGARISSTVIGLYGGADPLAAQHYESHRQQRTEVAAHRAETLTTGYRRAPSRYERSANKELIIMATITEPGSYRARARSAVWSR